MARTMRVRFSLKALLLATMAACICVSAVIAPLEEYRHAVRCVTQLGGRVRYSEASEDESEMKRLARKYLPREYVDNVIEVDLLNGYDVGNQDLKCLGVFTEMRYLSLSHSQVTDEGLLQLEKLRRLSWVYLYGTPVTDGGVSRLQRELPDCAIER